MLNKLSYSMSENTSLTIKKKNNSTTIKKKQELNMRPNNNLRVPILIIRLRYKYTELHNNFNTHLSYLLQVQLLTIYVTFKT